MERAIKARRHRPMFMVDLAVPRDIEPEVGELDDVFLYTVDDLAEHRARPASTSASPPWQQAEAIIETQVGKFLHWMRIARHGAARSARCASQGESARRANSSARMRMLARGDDPRPVLEALSHGLTNKLLHAPTQALHEAAGDDRNELAGAVDRLFRIRQRP